MELEIGHMHYNATMTLKKNLPNMMRKAAPMFPTLELVGLADWIERNPDDVSLSEAWQMMHDEAHKHAPESPEYVVAHSVAHLAMACQVLLSHHTKLVKPLVEKENGG